MNSAEIKKPPVAPKPKFVVGHKLVPPPVAPKPDVVLADLLQPAKKAKPAIAPKPKVLKCSSFPDVKTAPLSLTKNSKSLETGQDDSSEYLVNLNYKNGAPSDNTAYIISVCSCNFECIHKYGKNTCKNSTILEQLENLENLDIGEKTASSLKPRTILDSHNEKVINKNWVVLKANFTEEKLKGVLTHSISSNNGHLRQKPLNKLENNGIKIELKDLIQSSSSLEAITVSSDTTMNVSKVTAEISETPVEKVDTSDSCPDTYIKGGDVSLASFGTDVIPSTKALPVPKPRKLRVPCLVRQDGIDLPAEGIKRLDTSKCDSAGLCGIRKTAKINVLVQSVSYNNQEIIPKADESDITTSTAEKMYPAKEYSDSKELIPQTLLPQVLNETSHVEENVEHSLDHNTICSAKTVVDNDGVLTASNNKTSFIRCNNLSMSLPKQLKLSCNQHLPAFNSLDSSQRKEDKDVNLKGDSSPKIIPKKPQRHSLPAAGLLKKAASDEFVEKRTYLLNEETPLETSLEGQRIRHLSAKEQSTLLSCDTPKSSLEKPVWKLPHPILPFSGNPEALKNTKSSKSKEHPSVVTKPRAKSLSSVDIDRINKPQRETQKKNSLKKFLNMKLSVCIIKSDFQRFLAKGSQSTDDTGVTFSNREGHGKNWNITCATSGRKTKPSKCSPSSQKGKQRSRSQNEMPASQRPESLDEQPSALQEHLNSFSHDLTPEYENVSHYEEIPDYENLPFAPIEKNACFEWQNSSSIEDHDANIYEVEELYEATRSYSKLSRPLSEDHEDSDLVLGEVHSDEEMISRDVNSSDEDDDSNSDSGKGELDTQENNQAKAAGKKTKVHHIAKEIMSSEKVFVDVLKLLHIDFRDSVAQASRQLGKPVIEDRILNQILYYLPQLYELNRDLLRELEERLAHWADHQRIADIFVKKGPYLKMYSTYIKEFDKNVALLDEQCKKNPSFAAVVRDFETSPRCASLALKHYLLKPVQRIPQYRLLLTDYLKNLLEDSADFKDTQDALAVVIEVANHANDIMKQGDNFQKLMQIQYSLNGHHEIVQPGRIFLKEGTLMKLSRKIMQPRMFFLFNDALLYTTPVQSGMYKLNNMLSLAGMKVRKPTHEAYQNELNIESVQRSFILSASSATERDEWLDAISRSIEEYMKKRITFNPSRSLEEADPEKDEEDSPLGSKAPIWIPDTRATMCMICTSEFTLTWRRHHCRACGKIICQACSSNKHGLDYMKNQPARVCDLCFKELQKHSKLCPDNICTPSKNGSPVNHRSPSSALSTVLHSIPSGRKQKKIPAALKEVSANTEDSSMSGYLYRSKGSKKPWKHLWFVIKNKVLYTYAASEDVAALESQPLLGFTVAEVRDENAESKVFHLLHKNTLFYIFKADDTHSTQKWIEAFQEATVL
ncbi:PREDICTED: FYVE, RhoGEF and PH domain-containing protein 6 [Gekko japonicus]|uniref:FYVE, RhoGEF and PH domain-containing protein 6 n=1 Tax=Gekko japonicus TaxID=146911 RepID=A0ABM1K8U2_GEKJA|nr:PREDICTED: FYVE, RhoGEF and PH domain-containing protein 6 [Gekko japonicus]